jgi:hypothetical protein
VKITVAVRPKDHGLAIKHHIVDRQPGDGGRDPGEATRDVSRLSGPELDTCALFARQQPPAIVLELVEPVWSTWRDGAEGGLAGENESSRQAAPPRAGAR